MKKTFIKRATALALFAMTVMSFNPGRVYAYDVEQLKADYPNMTRLEQIAALEDVTLYDRLYITGGESYDQIIEIDNIKYCIKDDVLKFVAPKVEGVHLEELIIPEEAKQIGELAFQLVEIDKLVIHKDITLIDGHTCSHLHCKEVIVDEANEVYTSVDGVLFNKDMTTILAYPYEKEDSAYVVPDTVVSINCGGCFSGNPYLEKIQFGSSLKEGYGSILCSKNLEQIYIPGNEELTAKISLQEGQYMFKTDIATYGENFKIGDVSGDGQVTLEDARETLRAALMLEELSDNAKFAVTLDKETNVTLDHAQTVLRKALLLD